MVHISTICNWINNCINNHFIMKEEEFMSTEELLRHTADVLVNTVCDHCHQPVKLVYRTNMKDAEGIFHCTECLKITEPDLYKSIDANEHEIDNILKQF